MNLIIFDFRISTMFTQKFHHLQHNPPCSSQMERSTSILPFWVEWIVPKEYSKNKRNVKNLICFVDFNTIFQQK